MDYKNWACEFAEIGAALSEQRSLEELLATILTEVRKLTSSDAGSIYRVVEVDGQQFLKFELAQNDSIELPGDGGFLLKMNEESLAGYAAVSGEVLNIENVYDLPAGLPCSFDDLFDREFGYETKSVFVVPLRNRKRDVKGVLQLINCKNNFDLPYSQTEIVSYPEQMAELIPALASQAAVAMERAQLEESVQTMLESIIQTLVEATDRRDRVTSGHSRRLAEYATSLAEEVNNSDKQPWGEVVISSQEITAIYYAGLLHDIGKLAVPEVILNKENRLTAERMEALYYRLAYLQAQGQLADAIEIYDRLEEINRAPYLDENQLQFLEEIKDATYTVDGNNQSLIDEEDYENLAVRKGNLTAAERETIEGHARATYEILSGIEWTSELENVPDLAAAHHEKLNGKGYPAGLSGEQIPLGARILSVVDIYEALTAPDRPYKKPKNPDEARCILAAEAEAGAIDAKLVDLFFEKKVYDCDFSEELALDFS